MDQKQSVPGFRRSPARHQIHFKILHVKITVELDEVGHYIFQRVGQSQLLVCLIIASDSAQSIRTPLVSPTILVAEDLHPMRNLKVDYVGESDSEAESELRVGK